MKFKAPIEVESSLVDSSNSSGSAGQVLTSTGVGVDWIEPTLLPAESAEKVIQTVRFGEAVSKGDPLVITGYHGSNGPAIVERADATDATKMPAYGVALEDYANNATGLMIAVGDFNDFDTSSYSVSDTLYVAAGGGMTNVKPTGTALIQNMGIVSRSNANNGDVEIVAIGRTNDVPNLPTGRLFVGTATNTSLISDVVYVDDANDRVGIGTTSPSEKLEVSGSNTLSIKLSRNNTDATYVTTLTNNYSSTLGTELKSGTYNILTHGNSTGTALNFTNGAMTFDYRNSEYMRITSAGNVGIGTTSPTNKLDIRQSTSGGSDVLGTGAITIGSDNPYWTFRGTATSLQDLAFDRSYAGTWYESMRIQRSTGNVGIGTTSPSDKLQVSGVISATANDTAYSSGYFAKLSSDYGTNTLRLTSRTGDVFQATNFGRDIALLTGDPTSERMRITSSGNVGIGTTSPAYKLDVNGTNNENLARFYRDSNSATSISHLVSTGRPQTRYSYDSYTSWYVGNNLGTFGIGSGYLASTPAILNITSAGNVGIGTTSPIYKLDVSGIVRFTDTLRIDTTTDTALLLNATDDGPIYMSYARSGDRHAYVGFGGSSDQFTIMNEESAGSILLGTAGSTKVTILESGNVGIGTTSPSHKLTINASNNTTALGIDFPLAHFDFSANSTSGYTSNFRINDVGMDIGHDSTARSLNLQTGDQDRLTILGNGNVGIGTTSPAYKLQVAGAFYQNGTSFINYFDGDTRFGGSNSYSTIVKANGNVGIGTISPGYKLDVSGDAYIDETLNIETTISGTLTYGYGGVGAGNLVVGGLNFASFTPAVITLMNQDTTISAGQDLGVLQFGGKDDVTNGYANGQIICTTAGNAGTGNTGGGIFRFLLSGNSTGSGPTERMRITNTGNVGIGTTSPYQKLGVTGNVQIGSQGANVGFNIFSGTNVGLWNYENGYLRFGTNSAERMRITSTGNVGIGTTSPGSKLEVQGGDIEVDDSASGLILKSPDGTRYRITVENGGTLTVTAV